MVDHADDGPEEGAEGQAAGGGERVAKALARAGVASRRDVERYIAAGRVALNGRVLDTPAAKVAQGDILTVDGRVVEAAEATRLWRYHKPVGLLTSHGDPQGRPTVFQRLPEGLPRVISVGRLDVASEGLLLLTNDGELARKLELPNTGWKRVYRARAYGRADQPKLDQLQAGATVDGVRYGPMEARLDKATGAERHAGGPANLWITVTVEEGKNREVRRVLESIGLKVNRLIRLAYGPFALAALGVGEVQEVGPRVLREQLAELIAPGSMPKGDRAPPAPQRSARAASFAERSPKPSPVAPRTGKPGTRPTGVQGRLAEAWTPPSERKARKGPRPGAKLLDNPYKPRGQERPGSKATAGPKRASGKGGAAGPAMAPRQGPAGPRPASPRGVGPRAAAKAGQEAPKSAGMELTPPMRRPARRKGPGKPPRPRGDA